MKKIISIRNISSTKDTVLIHWEIGRRCNFNCSYCGDNLHDNFSTHVPFDTFKKTVDYIIGSFNDKTFRLVISGGEPTLNPDLLNFLSYINTEYSSKFQTIAILTNGSRTPEYFSKLAELVTDIYISYHFEFSKKERIFENAKIIKEKFSELKNLKVQLITKPGCVDKAKEVMKELDEIGVKYNVRRVKPKNVFRIDDEYRYIPQPNWDTFYTEDEISFFDDFSATNYKKTIEVSYDDNSKEDKSVYDIVLKNQNRFAGFWCSAGLESVHITVDGDVYRASCHDGNILGNIFTGFKLPSEQHLCKKSHCPCHDDIQITKGLTKIA